MFKCLFIILEAILLVPENGITRATVSLLSANSNISSRRFLFNPVGSSDLKVSIQSNHNPSCVFVQSALKYNHRDKDSCNQSERSHLRTLVNAYIKKKVDVFFLL